MAVCTGDDVSNNSLEGRYDNWHTYDIIAVYTGDDISNNSPTGNEVKTDTLITLWRSTQRMTSVTTAR